MFSHLNSSSNLLTWGGEVWNLATNGHHTTTEMGSGHFPSEGYGKASFFSNIEILNSEGKVAPAENLITQATRPKCYDVTIGPPNFPC
ncbi:neprosin family prolyl endopeptidase, partial [Salmonella sp. s57402]|uniref:neprosin family prolyl endopeptidase n=1 Tax=Salmonella sp. s57402 TaxID=3159695 RepID=UPI0039802F88